MRAPTSTFAILVTAAFYAHAAGVKRPAHLSGDEFMAQFLGLHNNAYVNAGTEYGRHFAQGYLAGVADATEGRSWCAPAHLTLGKADQQVISSLTQQPRRTQPAMASAMLLAEYVAKFPNSSLTCDFTPRLTGNQFVTWLKGDLNKPGITQQNQNAGASNRQRYAEGYVGGVVDATQGDSWCATARIKPDELDARGWGALLEQAPDSMPGNAAALLLQRFITSYPCSQP